jgi:hypothetical protein
MSKDDNQTAKAVGTVFALLELNILAFTIISIQFLPFFADVGGFFRGSLVLASRYGHLGFLAAVVLYLILLAKKVGHLTGLMPSSKGFFVTVYFILLYIMASSPRSAFPGDVFDEMGFGYWVLLGLVIQGFFFSILGGNVGGTELKSLIMSQWNSDLSRGDSDGSDSITDESDGSPPDEARDVGIPNIFSGVAAALANAVTMIYGKIEQLVNSAASHLRYMLGKVTGARWIVAVTTGTGLRWIVALTSGLLIAVVGFLIYQRSSGDSSSVPSRPPLTAWEIKQAERKASEQTHLESIAYERAKYRNTISAYQDYLREWPNGTHVEDAGNAISILK